MFSLHKYKVQTFVFSDSGGVCGEYLTIITVANNIICIFVFPTAKITGCFVTDSSRKKLIFSLTVIITVYIIIYTHICKYNAYSFTFYENVLLKIFDKTMKVYNIFDVQYILLAEIQTDFILLGKYVYSFIYNNALLTQ